MFCFEFESARLTRSRVGPAMSDNDSTVLALGTVTVTVTTRSSYAPRMDSGLSGSAPSRRMRRNRRATFPF
jgi:spore coat protein U-like protein